ncbi:MAG: hypothetical protein M1825_003385 [Sarcosagium campestre]|nr:MAG: hypothetical protein M1825_003385 [Sarcosagium campestre]
MAPSRGMCMVEGIRFLQRSRRPMLSFLYPSIPTRGYASVPLSKFAQLATAPTSKVQIYVSRSRDPYVNLSIEHFLLQKTPAHSTVLFLYTNRPCIVIGRNQNPWLEVNLALLKQARGDNRRSATTALTLERDVLLVRRRSGGGTVFHDKGNVNYSVICPTEDFDRDKHARMVVKALQSLDVKHVRVNERHDIVMDRPESSPLKISGSAYKLIRQRALHHGTCLLSTPHLGDIPRYLRSPAKPYIKARGVESVSSAIGNVGVSNAAFEHAVVQAFRDMHLVSDDFDVDLAFNPGLSSGRGWVAGVVDDSQADVPEIRKGLDELKSLDWIYLQTPQFSFSTYSHDEDPRQRPTLPVDLPHSTRVFLVVRSGKVVSSKVSVSDDDRDANTEAVDIKAALQDRSLHDVDDFESLLQGLPCFEGSDSVVALARFLNQTFGKRAPLYAA